MRVPPKLSKFEEKLLQEWVVGHGESWSSYMEFCAKYEIPEERWFTQHYFPRWVQKRRRLIQGDRQEIKDQIRRGSVLDREMRLKALEETFARLEKVISQSEDMTPRDLVSLEEQKRKTLEAIQRERGEWGVRPSTSEEQEDRLLQKAIGEKFLEHYSKKADS